jgi:hypothetical protein
MKFRLSLPTREERRRSHKNKYAKDDDGIIELVIHWHVGDMIPAGRRVTHNGIPYELTDAVVPGKTGKVVGKFRPVSP